MNKENLKVKTRSRTKCVEKASTKSVEKSASQNTSYVSICYEEDLNDTNKENPNNILVQLRDKLAQEMSKNESLLTVIKKRMNLPEYLPTLPD